TAGAAVVLALVVYAAVAWHAASAAVLLMIIYLSARLVSRLSSVQSSALYAIRAMPSIARLESLIDSLNGDAERPSATSADITLERELVGTSLSYRYPGASVAALSDVSFTVPAGRVTAIVGPSGAGKTTLVDLILGLLEPTGGALRSDDTAIDAGTRDAWRAAVGYVPQDGALFHVTVRDNVRWAAPNASDAEVTEALRAAGAAPFLAAHADGLDTIVGDRGALLSGGERQRIALARALVRKPALLVLDEATNALDEESERAIHDTLRALTPAVTVLMVTHRLAAAARADHVIAIDAGRLATRPPSGLS
nr:ATP-binding cassette domain-containing protein [Gemmatimonadaceae bacterium]